MFDLLLHTTKLTFKIVCWLIFFLNSFFTFEAVPDWCQAGYCYRAREVDLNLFRYPKDLACQEE